MENELKVTSIEELLKMGACGELVELPSFSENSKFIAKLRKPSLLGIVKSGKVPNELLVEANKLFANGAQGITRDTLNPEMMSNMCDLLDIVAVSDLPHVPTDNNNSEPADPAEPADPSNP